MRILTIFILFNIILSKLIFLKKLKQFKHISSLNSLNSLNSSSLNQNKNKKNNKKNEVSITFKNSLIAGGLARIISSTILHPLDSLRTRAQVLSSSSSSSSSNNNLNSQTLFRGVLPQIILSGPAGALQFSVLEVRY